jgi:hypothetical protein
MRERIVAALAGGHDRFAFDAGRGPGRLYRFGGGAPAGVQPTTIVPSAATT